MVRRYISVVSIRSLTRPIVTHDPARGARDRWRVRPDQLEIGWHSGVMLTIPRRFRGPARSANGGYTAGSLAAFLGEPGDGSELRPVVEVTLRRPPPLDVALTVRSPDGTTAAVLLDDDGPVAEARVVDRELTVVDEVDPDRAAAASSDYAGFRKHPFPGCFACGTDREEGDGLRIFPGPVAAGVVAAVWVPDASLAVSSDLIDQGMQRVGLGVTWAALDCVGGWSHDLEGRPSVLGRITTRVDALPVVGERHVVVGRLVGTEGRKTFTAATLYDSDARVVATAEHVWLQVDPAVFN